MIKTDIDLALVTPAPMRGDDRFLLWQAATGSVPVVPELEALGRFLGLIPITVFDPLAGTGGDDTAAFQEAAALGRPILLFPWHNYRLSAQILLLTGTRFICPFGFCVVTGITGAGGFTNVNIDTSKTGANVLFLANDKDNCGLEGMILELDDDTEVAVYPVSVFGGCEDVGFSFKRMRIRNFKGLRGGLLSINCVGEAAYNIEDYVARDCGTALGDAYWAGSQLQISVIEIDEAASGGPHSHPGVIKDLRGYRILLSGDAFVDAGGQQTDLLNVQRSSASSATARNGPTVIGAYAEGLGEMFDLFGDNGVIVGARAKDIEHDVCKMVYGASGWSVDIDVVENWGRSVVWFGGSEQPALWTEHNRVKIGAISGGGTLGLGLATASSVVEFGDPNTPIGLGNGAHRENLVEVHGPVVCGAALDYAVNHAGVDAAVNNRVNFRSALIGAPTTRRVAGVSGNLKARFGNGSDVRMELSGAQTITTAVQTTIAFNTVIRDRLGEALTGSNAIRVKVPGLMTFVARITMTGPVLNSPGILTLFKNGVAVSARELTSPGAAANTYEIMEQILILESEADTSAADVLAKVIFTSTGTLSILSTATRTFFEARQDVFT